MKFLSLITICIISSVILNCSKTSQNNSTNLVKIPDTKIPDSNDNVSNNDNLPEIEQLDASLTNDEKSNVLVTSQYILHNLYAHSALTTSTGLANDSNVFTKNPNAIDSVKLTDPDFLIHVEQAFEAQHDLHTQLIYPYPFQCYYAGLFPDTLSLKLAHDVNNTPYIAVATLNTEKFKQLYTYLYTNISADLIAQYTNLIAQLNNSVITNIDDVPVFSILEHKPGVAIPEDFNEVSDMSYGANSDAQISRGIENLLFRVGRLTHLPKGLQQDAAESKKIKITFQYVNQDGTINPNSQNITIPWFFWTDNNCVNENIYNSSSTADKISYIPNDRKLYTKIVNQMLNKTVNKLNSQNLKSLPVIDGIDNPPTKDSITTTNKKTFMYLNIPDFEPTVNNGNLSPISVNLIINNLQSDITNKWQGAAGIIVDVRNNGGGFTEYAQQLVQVLTNKTNFSPMYFRLLANNENINFLNILNSFNIDSNLLNIFNKPILDAMNSKNVYTTAKSDNGTNTLNGKMTNNLPPIYVVTNSNCYSSCDLFTARMKDLGAAKIISETNYTGGGGATVLNWSDYVGKTVTINNVTDTIKPTTPLPKNMDIRFAWQEMCSPVGNITDFNNVTPDNHTCRIVEGQGTITDEVIPLQLSEVADYTPFKDSNNKGPDSYIKRIAEKLSQ